MALMHEAHEPARTWLKLVLAAGLIISAATQSMAQVNAPAWWGTANNDTISLSFLFTQNTWQPLVEYQIAPAWYTGATWTRGGTKTPTWAAQISGHNGVMGLTDGFSGQGWLEVKVDNEYRPGWTKHVWYQFDVYQVAAQACYFHAFGESGTVFNEQTSVEQLSYGWQRVTTSFDIVPQPYWESFRWELGVDPSGKVAIDNVHIGTHCTIVPEPTALTAITAFLLALIGFARKRA